MQEMFCGFLVRIFNILEELEPVVCLELCLIVRRRCFVAFFLEFSICWRNEKSFKKMISYMLGVIDRLYEIPVGL